ncbi:hypothetical protein DRO97_10805 [Archaeoglobales archaeon]|nr:MAG: hypothetical protein DRO97_10805 [Archaeoglobales archaeon]
MEKKIRMYYGNPSTSHSNGEDVFEVYFEFNTLPPLIDILITH